MRGLGREAARESLAGGGRPERSPLGRGSGGQHGLPPLPRPPAGLRRAAAARGSLAGADGRFGLVRMPGRTPCCSARCRRRSEIDRRPGRAAAPLAVAADASTDPTRPPPTGPPGLAAVYRLSHGGRGLAGHAPRARRRQRQAAGDRRPSQELSQSSSELRVRPLPPARTVRLHARVSINNPKSGFNKYPKSINNPKCKGFNK